MKGNPPIESLILTIRGQRVILAADLAILYGVQTKVLNQAVKRNADRFPVDFSFQLCPEEFADLKVQGIATYDGHAALRSQIVTLNTPPLAARIGPLRHGRYAKYPPYAFTKHGAITAANVLNSSEAVAMSVYVV